MKLSIVKIVAGSVVALVALVALMRWNADSGINLNSEDPIRVYCAAGLRYPVQEIAKLYEEEYGHKVEIQYDGSGALMANFKAANDGDLYLAADYSYIERGQREGVLAEDMQIAWQRPVLIVEKDNPHGIESIEDVIAQIDDLRIVLPKPEVAAIGRVAQEHLTDVVGSNGETTWDYLMEHVLTSRDTVNAVANDIDGGFADVGIVWDSTAAQDEYENLLTISIPQLDAAKAQISVAVIAHTEQPTRALHFARFLTAHDRGLEYFDDFHFDIIDDGDKWANKPEITIFAGGLNRLAVEDMITQFGKREGVNVIPVFSGCGVLVGMMNTGEQPDMYFACDVTFMEKVQDRFYASVDVSQTAMVIIVPKGNPHDIQSLEDFAGEGLKVGITNPEHSALGALSRDLLIRNGLWEQVDGRFADQPSTADTLVQQVALGAMDAAIVYHANYINQAHSLDLVEIDDPTAFAVQPIAIARDSQYKHLTQRLVQRIRAVQSEALFKELGFGWLNDPSILTPIHDGDVGTP